LSARLATAGGKLAATPPISYSGTLATEPQRRQGSGQNSEPIDCCNDRAQLHGRHLRRTRRLPAPPVLLIF